MTNIKYLHEFQNKDLILNLLKKIREEAKLKIQYNFMEFCGGHTHTIFRYGFPELLPKNVRMVHGPGCPVCVLPANRIDGAINLLKKYPDLILCTYGDMMRVPGNKGISFLKFKAEGANIKMVYSPMDALLLAENNPDKRVIFMAIGFETTTPATAFIIKQAAQKKLNNFFVYCQHVLTPPAIGHILEAPQIREIDTVEIHGFIGPGHVSAVIGTQPFEYFAEEFQKPVAVTGFTPLDILQGILMLIRQVNENKFEVENQYNRTVTRAGNLKSQEIVSEVFQLREKFEWRGLGSIPYSALKIREQYANYDAEKQFEFEIPTENEHKGCECGAILRGAKIPLDCKLFGKICTPENPIGSCMVSSEGACSAYFQYGIKK